MEMSCEETPRLGKSVYFLELSLGEAPQSAEPASDGDNFLVSWAEFCFLAVGPMDAPLAESEFRPA